MAAGRLAAVGAAGLGLALLPGRAQAHAASATVGDLYAGGLHLLSSPEHLLPLLGLGLLLGAGGRKATTEPLLLILLLALGAGAGLGALAGAVELPRALGVASLLLVGLLVAAAARLPRPALAALTLVLGLAHGFANGAAMAPGMRADLFVPSVMLAGFVTTFYAMALAALARPFWARIAVRVAGSWIAATGILVLGMRH